MLSHLVDLYDRASKALENGDNSQAMTLLFACEDVASSGDPLIDRNVWDRKIQSLYRQVA